MDRVPDDVRFNLHICVADVLHWYGEPGRAPEAQISEPTYEDKLLDAFGKQGK